MSDTSNKSRTNSPGANLEVVSRLASDTAAAAEQAVNSTQTQETVMPNVKSESQSTPEATTQSAPEASGHSAAQSVFADVNEAVGKNAKRGLKNYAKEAGLFTKTAIEIGVGAGLVVFCAVLGTKVGGRAGSKLADKIISDPQPTPAQSQLEILDRVENIIEQARETALQQQPRPVALAA